MHKLKSGRVNPAIDQDPFDLFLKGIRTYLLENCNGAPYRVKALGLLRSRDFVGLLNLADSIAETVYSAAAEHLAANQFVALVKKYPFPPSLLPGIDPEQTAVRKFLASEHRCKWVNRRFRGLKHRPGHPMTSIMDDARAWIEKVIGDEPPLSKIYELCDFSSGASLGVHGNKTNLGRKLLSSKWTVTPSALPYATAALWRNFQIREYILGRETIADTPCHDHEKFVAAVNARAVYVSYNKLSFVPKTAKTLRSIAVEPLLNGFIQKGTDNFLKACLARYGIDLTNQQLNQKAAYLGSLGGFNPYVSIDLKSASDSVSIELVKHLLPPAWFDFLNCTRSPSYSHDGSIRRYEKFVSMGNGFCFPLETLLFAALSIAACKEMHNPVQVIVYGDDILVRQSMALRILEILRFAGFAHNRDKTFIFGPFRESCGADWYHGQDVRPVYWKDAVTDVRQAFALHNSTLRSEGVSILLEPLRKLLRDHVPKHLRFMRIGTDSGDTCFSVPQDVFMSCAFTKWSIDEQRWKWTELLSIPVADTLDSAHYVNYIAVLRGASSEQPLSVRRMTKVRRRIV